MGLQLFAIDTHTRESPIQQLKGLTTIGVWVPTEDC
jgi:hypothetical protein